MSAPRQIAVVSGKGGTGKTSLCASLARLGRPLVAADCDVDAANMALLLMGLDGVHMPFFTGRRASVDLRRCQRCGTCAETCRFDAVALGESGLPRLDPFVCEGCGACTLTCPSGALYLHENQAGVWTVRPTDTGPLVHALLGVAQDNSGTLVTQVRQEAQRVARAEGLDLVLLDGPPGIGSPVLATVEGVDLVLVVTEPTPSGSHDLIRILDLAAEAGTAAAVVINKADLDPDVCQSIEELSDEAGVPVVGQLPFEAEVPRALARGELPLSVPVMQPLLQQLWERVSEILDEAAAELPRRKVDHAAL